MEFVNLLVQYGADLSKTYLPNKTELADYVAELLKQGMPIQNIPIELLNGKNEIIWDYVKKLSKIESAKNWDIADKIRRALDKAGIVLKDSKEGTSWEVKS